MARLIGIVVGAAVAFLLLLLFQGPDGPRFVADATQGYLVAVIAGAIVTWLWPILSSWYLGRRARARERGRIDSEVERRLDQERHRGD